MEFAVLAAYVCLVGGQVGDSHLTGYRLLRRHQLNARAASCHLDSSHECALNRGLAIAFLLGKHEEVLARLEGQVGKVPVLHPLLLLLLGGCRIGCGAILRSVGHQ